MSGRGSVWELKVGSVSLEGRRAQMTELGMRAPKSKHVQKAATSRENNGDRDTSIFECGESRCAASAFN